MCATHLETQYIEVMTDKMGGPLSHAVLTLTRMVMGAGRLSGTPSHALLAPATSHTSLADSLAHHGMPILLDSQKLCSACQASGCVSLPRARHTMTHCDNAVLYNCSKSRSSQYTPFVG